MFLSHSKNENRGVGGQIKSMPVFNEIKAEVLADLQTRKKFSVDDETIRKEIQEILCKRIIYNKIRNCVLEVAERPTDKPWIDQSAVDKIQARWVKRAQKGLQNMCSDLHLSMAKNRPLSERIKLEEKWTELGTAEELDTPHLRPVYSSKDMLEFLRTIDAQTVGGSAHISESRKRSWQALGNLPGQAPSFRELDFFAFKCLKQELFNWDLMIDRLVYKDVKETASNDDQYFVFEDLLYQILLMFFRRQLSPQSANSDTLLIRKHVLPLKNLDRTSAPIDSDNPTVMPFFGFSYHAAPFCFVTTGPVRCLKMFTKMYEKYFWKLQNISNDFQSILYLTKLFEELLNKREPKLSDHFEENCLNPTVLAFKWMMRGFSGHLSSEQVLDLWDRILGFASLTILPLLAAALFSDNRKKILETKSQEELTRLFHDMTEISVIDTLESFLHNSAS